MSNALNFRVQLNEYIELGERCAHAKNSETLAELLSEIKRGIGAAFVAYHHFPPFGTNPSIDPVTIICDGFEDDRIEAHVRAQLWRNSDAVRRALHSGAPFVVDSMMPDNSEEHGPAARYSNDLTGHFDVIAFAVFGPQGRSGYFNYWMPKSSNADPLEFGEMLALQSVGQISHLRYCVLRKAAGMTEPVDLTEREVGVLSCVADGHTIASTAARIGITSSQVRSSTRSAGVKLGVQKDGKSAEHREAAILKAAALGELTRTGSFEKSVIVRTPHWRRLVSTRHPKI